MNVSYTAYHRPTYSKDIYTSNGFKHESTPIPPEPSGLEIDIQQTTILDFDNLSAWARNIEEQLKLEL